LQPDLVRGDTLASDDLFNAMGSRGRRFEVAKPGSDEERLLDYFGANASVNTADPSHILVRPDARKIEVLEEFLHGTQLWLGIVDRLGDIGSEIHVKNFMIRHQRLLGLSDGDVEALTRMRNSYLRRVNGQ